MTHPVSLRGGQTCFLIVFYAILRQILNYCFCAISLRELSICVIFTLSPTMAYGDYNGSWVIGIILVLIILVK